MNTRLSRLALSDEGFVFDPQSGDSYQVSETGLQILRGLQAGQPVETVAQRLAERFEITLEEAQRDCADFCARLKQFELAA